MVKIRLQKLGRRHRSFFRIVVTDVRAKRQGTYLEKLGQLDPLEKDAVKQLTLNTERAKHWLALGAQPTPAVASLLEKAGVTLSKPKVKKPKKAKQAPQK